MEKLYDIYSKDTGNWLDSRLGETPWVAILEFVNHTRLPHCEYDVIAILHEDEE